MHLDHGELTVELDHDDIAHLVSSGTTTVDTEQGDLQVRVACRQGIKFDVHLQDEEAGE